MEEIYERELTKLQILEGNYIYPLDFIKLKPTKHVLQRLGERGLELDCLPTVVRVTENNLYSGKTQDDKHLHSVVIRLEYTSTRFLYLCLNPFDGGLKSVWFRTKARVAHERRRRDKDNILHRKPSVQAHK